MSTPDELRAEAKQHDRDAYESFERCDTDGFLSQWASGIMAREKQMRADLMEAGGYAEFPALFTTDGRLIPNAREVETRYGWAWVYNTESGPVWFNPSKARDDDKARANNAKKGYYIGRVTAQAYVKIVASGTGLSGAASARPAVLPVIENGQMIIRDIVDNGKDN